MTVRAVSTVKTLETAKVPEAPCKVQDALQQSVAEEVRGVRTERCEAA
jgi:hypothetical protein